MQVVLDRQKGGHGPRCSSRNSRNSPGDESSTTCAIICSLFVDNIIYRMLCFEKAALQRFPSYTLISHTNAHSVRGRPTLNDVERF